ncbi:DEAD/DEAH box helicase [Capnocytophaga leadbetteri]|jgi:hypothetical protein CLOST_1256|uniref:DEAD/DEAH box helicase n=1 Tax=Capnocytophaga leadbetteri TaxID=327575 RepID=UPI00391F5493
MKKFTANYAYTNSNFVIQNLKEGKTEDTDLYAFCCILKNILQRGVPTTMSEFLQEKLGIIHEEANFKEILIYSAKQQQQWHSTIKGGNINPARDFFERIIPNEFGEYAFVQSLIIPEIEINDICGYNAEFVAQQVDFYLPQAKLVIEIDGSQHFNPAQQQLDYRRDVYLINKGIEVVRISTQELLNGVYHHKIEAIINRLNRCKDLLDYYSPQTIEQENQEELLRTKYLPTAIIRFQLLVLELLMSGQLKLQEDWYFSIFTDTSLPNFAQLAIDDLLIWLDHLYLLKNKTAIQKPQVHIEITKNEHTFKPNAININFSLHKRYTDEDKRYFKTIFVRTDYFDNFPVSDSPTFIEEWFKWSNVNYFVVSTSQPIRYNITKQDEKTLEFFLKNIFDKPSFLDGQFPILQNALNRRDTIGLLPTGGGKSLCYQLPCLLQPAISFVVCPIKSLMYDQKDNLEKIFISQTNWITSDLEATQKDNVLSEFAQGKYLFLWISPERFQIQSFRDKISEINKNFTLAYAVIDEVHCLSEWGHDFRLSYLNLAKTIDKLSPKDENGEGTIKFLGLTATASVNVLKDIKVEFSRQKASLEDNNIKTLTDYSRKELIFEVVKDKGKKQIELLNLIEKLKKEEYFLENDEKAGLIFTPNVNGQKGCYALCNNLNNSYQGKVEWYSGTIPNKTRFLQVSIPEFIINDEIAVIEEVKKKLSESYDSLLSGDLDEIIKNNIGLIRNRFNHNTYLLSIEISQKITEKAFKAHKDRVQKGFKENKFPLMVVTKSFGMGIDKDNVFYTIHYGIPTSVESLYQEAGRAGRWDKNKEENKDKKGKCYVLFSPETYYPKEEYMIAPFDVMKIFDQQTTIQEIRKIQRLVDKEGKDAFTQIYLFLEDLSDVEDDLDEVIAFKNQYFQEGVTKFVQFRKADKNKKEKLIYRLSLLGLVKDWTSNFTNSFQVTFGSEEENNILKSLENYIGKYEPTKHIKSEIEKVNEETFLKKATKYLLQWIFDHIVYNRKQSLKTLYDWCLDFKGSDDFKARLDSYFVFNDVTAILQTIGEKPFEYEQWFKVFYYQESTNEIKEGNYVSNNIFIPAIKDNRLKNEKYRNLQDAVSRFLESYQNNVGLNFISGLIRLALDDFNNLDGESRFKRAFESIKNDEKSFPTDQQNSILEKLVDLGSYFKTEQKEILCDVIKEYYPEKLEFLAEKFDLPYLLYDNYFQKLQQIKDLNTKLYEQVRTIR